MLELILKDHDDALDCGGPFVLSLDTGADSEGPLDDALDCGTLDLKNSDIHENQPTHLSVG